jgi:hypothetical protein
VTAFLENLEIIDGPELVSAYDELSLWSAPFGQLLLRHVPLRRKMRVLDGGDAGPDDESRRPLA